MKTDPDFHPEAAAWLDGTATDGSRRLLNDLLHEPGTVEEFAALSRTDALLRACGSSVDERRAALTAMLAGKAWPLRALSLLRRPSVPRAAAAALIAMGAWALWPSPAPEPQPEPVIAKPAPSPQLMPVSPGAAANEVQDSILLRDKKLEDYLRRYYIKPTALTGSLPTVAPALAKAVPLADGKLLEINVASPGDAPVWVSPALSMPVWTILEIFAIQSGTEVETSDSSVTFRQSARPVPVSGRLLKNIPRNYQTGFLSGKPDSLDDEESLQEGFRLLARDWFNAGDVRFKFQPDGGCDYFGPSRPVIVLEKAMNESLPVAMVTIEVKVVELSGEAAAEEKKSWGTIPAGSSSISGVLTHEQFQLTMQALLEKKGGNLLTQAPIACHPGKSTNMEMGVVGLIIEATPSEDQLSLDLNAQVTLKDKNGTPRGKISAQILLWSGQTISMGGLETETGSALLVYTTAQLVTMTGINPMSKLPKSPDSANSPAMPDGLPYGIPVPGKPGFIYSPYAQDKGFVDVAGLPQNTRVMCPYSRKPFRVP